MNRTEELTQSGFCTLQRGFGETEIGDLCDEMVRCESEFEDGPVQSLLKTSELVRKIAAATPLLETVHAHLGPNAVPFSAFFLDKSAHSNWQMPWHQNLRIPVETPAPVTALVENGVAHIIPDAAYLGNVLIARISLDAQRPENGALEVIPGSHLAGILDETAVAAAGDSGNAICPALAPGDIFFFNALLVHRSKPSLLRTPRRVLQIEYAPGPPSGCRWFGLT
ncbi:MAG: phytanoyl-CoA dioxygenase family protein [Turneriella sp.]|nr:phytanoyl-CoA dioxygenase family protein [Turneriella sp.]